MNHHKRGSRCSGNLTYWDTQCVRAAQSQRCANERNLHLRLDKIHKYFHLITLNMEPSCWFIILALYCTFHFIPINFFNIRKNFFFALIGFIEISSCLWQCRLPLLSPVPNVLGQCSKQPYQEVTPASRGDNMVGFVDWSWGRAAGWNEYCWGGVRHKKQHQPLRLGSTLKFSLGPDFSFIFSSGSADPAVYRHMFMAFRT